MSPEASRRSLLQMLSTRLIPLAMREDQSPLVFMDPVGLYRHRDDILLHRSRPLSEQQRMRSPLYLHRWIEQGVHSVRFPCLAAVVEGEIDWRIGVTESVAQSVTHPVAHLVTEQEVEAHETSAAPKNDTALQNCDYMVVPVREGTFFLMPPGVPYSDGSGMHWERPTPRKNPAVIFWLLVLPSGFMCHFCRSTSSEHFSHRQFFVPCPQIHQLAKMLEEELRDSPTESQVLARLHLQAILNYALRGLQLQTQLRSIKADSMAHHTLHETHDSPTDTLQRARNFIEIRLQEPINPESIAEHVYLSARQLDRYFHRELNTSIMDYVIMRRVEMAKNLLQVTDLSIQQIAHTVGYRNQSSFTQIFKRRAGVSPQQYRQRERSEGPAAREN